MFIQWFTFQDVNEYKEVLDSNGFTKRSYYRNSGDINHCMTSHIDLSSNAVISRIPVIRSPRAPWLEFILHFATGGFYTCVWFVLRAREINRLSGKVLTPWLWFFVPYMPIAQVIALPRFLKQWNLLAGRHQVSAWSGWQGAWVIAVIAVTGFAAVNKRFELPAWAGVLGMITWAGLFAVLQQHVNRVKDALNGVSLKGARRNYSAIEWGAVVIGLPLMLGIYGTLMAKSLRVPRIQPLQADSVYTDPNGIFRMPIAGKGWSIVKSGTHSDGSAVLELQGPLQDMAFVVFKHDRSTSLGDAARGRTMENLALLKGGRCAEERVLASQRIAVISRIHCIGRDVGGLALITHTFLETDEGLYELRGALSTVRRSFTTHVPDFKRMASGFELL